MNESSVGLTRKELYDLVWSTPLLTLSKQYNLSDTGFRKLCRRINIPLPNAGHWMKRQHGKKVRIRPLPDQPGEEEPIMLSLRIGPSSNPMKVKLEEIKNDPKLSFKIPDRLNSKDPLILASKEGLTRKDIYGYRKPTPDDVVHCWEALDIKICQRNITRALIFMDTLIKLIRARGHEIILHNQNTYAVMYEERIQLKLREKMKRVVTRPDDKWNQTDLVPTGLMYLRLEDYYAKEWIDGKVKLEEQLPEILAKLELHAMREREETIEREKRWAEEAEIERHKEELLRRKLEDLENFKKLLANSKRWHKAVNLRNYIAEFEKRISNTGTVTNELKSWIAWAKDKADWYDPFMQKEDDIHGLYNEEKKIENH